MKKLNDREQELLDIIRTHGSEELVITKEIYEYADMARGTAIKYLASLQGKGLIDCKRFGNVNIWWVVQRCPICNMDKSPVITRVCPKCENATNNETNKELIGCD